MSPLAPYKVLYFFCRIMDGQRHGQYHDSHRIFQTFHELPDYGAYHGNPGTQANARAWDGTWHR
jgi:hypothetical protein